MRFQLLLAALAASLSWCAPAAAQKISDLPAAATLTGTEKLAGIQGSGCASHVAPCANVAVTAAQIATLANSSLDAQLVALAALTPSADACTYWTSSTAVTTYGCTSFARGLGSSSDAASFRSAIGLGTLATQGSGAVAITGGSITGITDLAITDGGTGASTASAARSNLSAAGSGANSDITSLSGLTTALSVAQGGTGGTSASAARSNLGVTATGSDTAYAFRSNNLSDLSSVSTARTNLGLSPSAGTLTLTVLSGAGTGATGSIVTFPNGARVTLNAGTGSVAGDLFTLTYGSAFSTDSIVSLTGGNGNVVMNKMYATGTSTTATISVAGAGLTASLTYIFNVFVSGK